MVDLGSADQHLSEQCFARVLSSQPSKLSFYEDRRDYSCCIIIQIAWSADSLQSLLAFTTQMLLFTPRVSLYLHTILTFSCRKPPNLNNMRCNIVQTTSLRLQLGCASCVTPTVQPPRPPRAAPKGCQVRVLEYGSPRGPNQAEVVRPQGYRVGSVLTSRDPAHPENAPNGCLHHRLHAC